MIEQWVTALKQGDIETAKRLLAENPELIQMGADLTRPYLKADAIDPYEAAATGQTGSLRHLDPERIARKGPGGWSVLHLSSYFGHLEAVAWLIEAGADVNAQAGQGITPLHLAASRGHREIAQTLLAKGADRSIKADNGQTAADLARQRGYDDLAPLL